MAHDFGCGVTRTPMPVQEGAFDVSDLRGGQYEWTWAVAMPYRVLADSFGVGVMPASPASTLLERATDSQVFGTALGYFACLQSFLTYSFGWARHDRGLLWWYDNGRPIDDRRFALLKAIWEADGLLLRYLAWCVDRTSGVDGIPWLGEPLHKWAVNVDRDPLRLTDAWTETLRRERDSALAGALTHHPWGKHLEHGDHIGAPSGADWAGYPGAAGQSDELSHMARLVQPDPFHRRATLVSDVPDGWYAALAERGASLPQQPGDPSWRIDVFIKQYGYVGEYRRSRRTGLWFSGRHRHHTVGN